MFEAYLGDWYMASGETAEKTIANALGEAYIADLIGSEHPRISEVDFIQELKVSKPEHNGDCDKE